jgi:hypothetical protein
MSTIAENIKNIKTNSIYDYLIGYKCTDIITTNYDYLIEKSLLKRGKGIGYYKTEYADQDETLDAKTKKLGKNREKKYRLYTKNECFGTNVWHIHGEINYPKTMVLGYEYYLAVVGEIQKHLKLIENGFEKKSWIQLLLQKKVDILGYELDYSESTIWFVLNYRAREIAENKIVKNQVSYHVLSKNMNEGKRKLLNGYYIDVIEYDYESYKLMYKDFFENNS